MWNSSISFLLILVMVKLDATNGEPLVPALFIFGNSIVDVGNNNYRATLIKANFFPYGRDFVTHYPTGRFSNGKLVVDLASEIVGFTSYQPAYLNLNTKGNKLLNGANFASAASGYHYSTATLYGALPLNLQLEYYKDCQKELVKIAGQSNATSIISGAMYLLVTGVDDFIMNYRINPLLQKVYTPDQFSDVLMQCYSKFIQDLYALGARKIGVATLPPIGCLPIVITFSPYSHTNKCDEQQNDIAINFNKKLNYTSEMLLKMLPELKLVILDIYQPLYKLVSRPSDYGFVEARRGCCGTGLLEVAISCNPKSTGTCVNASGYVFWDGFHPTEAANKFLIDHLIPTATSLMS